MGATGELNLVRMSGEMRFSSMTDKVALDDLQYSALKMSAWLQMLNNGMKPVSWAKPNRRGTRVKWESINSREEENWSFDELEGFVNAIKKRFGADIELIREEVKRT
ncbi:hypothetical protein WJ0W_006920 [Paenibacillus melissococcoides]|uniref:Uncharacterized protein n=1 Tax=Paenibacillus melissococcoides TaxID=2912268 RepID=A0ABM9G3Q3_9BACL|nr:MULTISPECIES: hypothetical protein [Paenibacillus]MEB9894856.1 hypothetical protein [Bacillus cereus]CAH8246320.1 hypothetical protein WJ0W_003555 [Paenibacillus melissococcoides]CAH8248424.1 hypothetical protein WJ0W_005687 [Paenibacillus melissococcoides]CAH8249456.1 hypothetical protein WJ0W_006641 [Paenibacillus melissococcoides]CAH8249736.1 hypothetical protein WJ0W_006920 [Paenibacillus melissococcoides]